MTIQNANIRYDNLFNIFIFDAVYMYLIYYTYFFITKSTLPKSLKMSILLAIMSTKEDVYNLK